MKLMISSLLTAACVFSQVHASSQSTVDTATAELEEITTQTKNLTKTIHLWNGTTQDIDTALEINVLSTKLVDYIKNATTQLKSVPAAFDATQAFDIGAPTQYLAYAVNASIAALIQKKAGFEAGGLGSLVVSSLKTQLSASNNFSDVLLSYVPSDILPVAEALNSQITESLNEGLACFQNQNASCITAVVNPNRTYDQAVKYGAIAATSAATRTASVGGAVALGMAVVAAVFAL